MRRGLRTRKEEKSMRPKESIVIVSMLVGCLLFLPTLEAQTAGGSGTPGAVTEEEVRQFIDTYIDRYKAMDLDPFMDLFSSKAVENGMLPRADIRGRYQKWFAASRRVSFDFTLYTLQTNVHRAFVTGRYKIVQIPKREKKMKISEGNIQWELVREDNSLKIRTLNYGWSGGND